jgi:SAM-dependent methyltransferase
MKIFKKIYFKKSINDTKKIGNVKNTIILFKQNKNRNLHFLIKKRFEWMNNYIVNGEKGLEVGAGAGFSKIFTKNKSILISDFSNDTHLDIKNLDAQNTKLKSKSFDYIIAANMIHHLPYPMKFFKEMNRILKKKGKLIIFEPNCSIILQVIMLITRHEEIDFTKNVWNSKNSCINNNHPWNGNNAIPDLIFDDKIKFNKNLEKRFKIIYEDFSECFTFINSGGVYSKNFYIPLNNFLLNIIFKIENLIIKIFPKIFALGRKIVLTKTN